MPFVEASLVNTKYIVDSVIILYFDEINNIQKKATYKYISWLHSTVKKQNNDCNTVVGVLVWGSIFNVGWYFWEQWEAVIP